MKKLSFLILFAGIVLISACQKSKVRNNLKDEWNLTVLSYDSNNLVSESTAYTLEFYDVKKAGGNVIIKATDVTGTYPSSGTFTFNKDHTRIELTLVDGSHELYWEVDVSVDENNLTLSGMSNDNVGSSEAELLVIGMH